MIEENIKSKIQQLISRAARLTTSSQGIARNSLELSLCQGWITEALNIVQLAIPMPSNAYRQRVELMVQHQSGGALQCVGSIAQILNGLLSDLDAGLLGELGNKIRAETFDDFLDHSEAYRQQGKKSEAGVIAGVVFEDTIRRIHRDKIGNDKGQSLEDLINSLTKKSLITGQQSKSQGGSARKDKGNSRSMG